LFIVVAMWGVSDGRGVGCFVSCSLLLPCGVSPDKEGIGKKTTKNGEKNPTKNKTKKQVSPSEKPMLIRRGADKREKNKEKGGKKRAEWQGQHGKS
jgi:hypothetical protein